MLSVLCLNNDGSRTFVFCVCLCVTQAAIVWNIALGCVLSVLCLNNDGSRTFVFCVCLCVTQAAIVWNIALGCVYDVCVFKKL